MTRDQAIQELTNRFLSWKLPADFMPDGGISFKAEYSNGTPEGGRFQPVGTNLFNAPQAKALIDHLLDGIDVAVNLQDKLEEIISCSAAKAPPNCPTVGFPPAQPDDDDRANEIVYEAFQEGRDFGYWEACAKLSPLLEEASHDNR